MSDVTTETGFFDGKLSQRLHYRWDKVDKARGAVVLIHGLAEHIGRYDHVFAALTARGYSCFGYDHRGHGRSEGRRAFINRFSEYTEDVSRAARWVAEAAPGQPIFLIAHSMGGLIGIQHLIDYPGVFAGAILSAPALAAAVAIPKWKDALGRVMSKVVPTLAIPTGIPPAHVSRDPAVVSAYDNDPLRNKKATARWYTEFLGAQERAMERARSIKTPTLVLIGGSDKICDPRAMQTFYEALGAADKSVKPYPALYHEIFNEPEQDSVLTDVGQWLDAHSG